MPTTKRRISISLEDGEYAVLSTMAEKHNLSMAWLGRKAILDLLDRWHDNSLQLPLVYAEHGSQPEWAKNTLEGQPRR